MFRALLISFFLITSTVLYMDRGSDQGSATSTPYSLVSQPTVSAPRTVRTVAKPYTNRRFTNKEDIANAQIEQKQAQQAAEKQVAVIKPRLIAPVQTAPIPLERVIDPSNKHRIALLIKAELKQLGCFKGTISGSWETSAQNALSHFNMTTAQNLETGKPSLQSLTALKGYSGKACRGKYRVVQKLPSLELAHLPTSKPQFIPDDGIATILSATAAPATIASAAIAKRAKTQDSTANNNVIAQAEDQDSYKPAKRTAQRKAKNKKIRKFAEQNNPNTFFNNFSTPRSYYAKRKKYRPAAYLVGTRKANFARKRAASKAARNARRLRQIRARHHRMKRKKLASRKKFRRVRRRYRRYRKRFGFSNTGEVGYW